MDRTLSERNNNNVDGVGNDNTSNNRQSGETHNRIIVVTNRLPVSIQKKSNGEWEYSRPSGGLVTALKQLQNMEMHWIGCPGFIDEDSREFIREKLFEYGVTPVFIEKDTYDEYYSGFANAVIWPLFHYRSLIDDIVPHISQWFLSYSNVNNQFAKVIEAVAKPGDLIWIHDYHLLLLPAYLRRIFRDAKIGFFLHIPFPTVEQFRILPNARTILQGLLASNFVGFHTHDYTQHFKSCCKYLLGCEVTPEHVIERERVTVIGTLPIGTDPDSWKQGLLKTNVQEQIAQIRNTHKDKKIILGVDRLDYIKGIPHKLYMFERFLEDNPSWIDKVVLIQIAVPTRENVDEYRELAKKCHELVGRINAKFCSVLSMPIYFLDRVLGFDDLCALYHASDVCLVSSLRDGMNLVSYEYVSCQDEKNPGVLIISEFAGSAQSLGAGAISVNPWDISSMSIGLRNALKLNLEQRKAHQKILYDIVSTHTVQNWASSFIKKTNEAWITIPRDNPIVPPRIQENIVQQRLEKSKCRVIILGLFGALTPYQKPFMSRQHYAPISTRMKQCIQQLNNDKNTTIAIISSATCEVLNSLIGDMDVLQYAEKGYFVKNGNKDIPWHCVVPETIHLQWKEQMRSIIEQMNFFSSRLPRTHVEVSETAITFKYDELNESNSNMISTMITNVRRSLVNAGIVIHDLSSNMIEVRSNTISLENTIQQILSHVRSKYNNNDNSNDNNPIDFVLYIGNLMAHDEKIFDFLNELSNNNDQLKGDNVLTVTVGRKATRAKYYALNTQHVENIIYECAQTVKKQDNLNTSKPKLDKNENTRTQKTENINDSRLTIDIDKNDGHDRRDKYLQSLKSAPVTPNFSQHPTIAMHPLSIFEDYQNNSGTSSSASSNDSMLISSVGVPTLNKNRRSHHRETSHDHFEQIDDEDNNINEDNLLPSRLSEDNVHRSKSDSIAMLASSMYHFPKQHGQNKTDNKYMFTNNVENYDGEKNVNPNYFSEHSRGLLLEPTIHSNEISNPSENNERQENILWYPGFVHSLCNDGNTVVSSSQLNKNHENLHEN